MVFSEKHLFEKGNSKYFLFIGDVEHKLIYGKFSYSHYWATFYKNYKTAMLYEGKTSVLATFYHFSSGWIGAMCYLVLLLF